MLRIKDESNIRVLVTRIERQMAEAFEFGSHRLSLDASIGWALYPQDGCEVATLLESADRMM